MENAVQALKTAASVLIFVIAITTAFVMFSKAKVTADAIITAQDKQKYLESPDVKGGILYTSSEDISSGDIETMTNDGFRYVTIDDVIATLYRYSIEKYGVTIVEKHGVKGKIIARFDSNTENIMRQYYSVQDETKIQEITDKVKENTSLTGYIETDFSYESKNNNTLYNIYRINVAGNDSIKCGEQLSGNDTENAKRINEDITGGDYIYNKQTYNGKKIIEKLKNKKIIEVVNTIDTSKYLKDEEDNNTSLQTDYQLPTVEIIYIIQ